MAITTRYIRGRGMFVDMSTSTEGISFLLGEHLTVAAIERHLHEVQEWLL